MSTNIRYRICDVATAAIMGLCAIASPARAQTQLCYRHDQMGRTPLSYFLSSAAACANRLAIAQSPLPGTYCTQPGALCTIYLSARPVGAQCELTGRNPITQTIGTEYTPLGSLACSGIDPDKNVGACPRTDKPVGIGSGGKSFSESDFASVRPDGLRWTRSYNASIARQGPVMSVNWTHIYSRRVQTLGVGATTTFFLRADGSVREAALVDATIANQRQRWAVDSTQTEQLYRTYNASNAETGWLVIDTQAGTMESYDTNGRLRTLVFASGMQQTLTYSDGSGGANGGFVLDSQGAPTSTVLPAGLLIRVADSWGRLLTLGYDSQSHLVRVADPAGNAYRYTYDATGNLHSVLYPGGASRQYLYNETSLTGGVSLPYAITGLIDESGNRLGSYSYDSVGRVVDSHWWADSNQTQAVGGSAFSYGAGSVTTVTDALGTQRSYAFTSVNDHILMTSQSQPAGSGCAASTSARSYDTNGNVASADDFNGSRVCYAHDLARNLETVRVEGLPAGASGTDCDTVTPVGANLPTGSRKTSTQWHPDWRLPTKVAEPGRITTSVYNGQPDPFAGGAVASCASGSALLPDGKPIAVLCKKVEQATSDVDGSQGFNATLQPGVPARTWQYSYNAMGQVLSATDVLNHTTNYGYYVDTVFAGADPNAVGHTLGDLQSVTNALNQTTTFDQYDKDGNWLQSTDPNGVVSVNTYDARQRLTSASVGGQTTSYAYWPTGLIKQVTLPDASTVTYVYDTAHRLTGITDSLGNSVSYTLDAAGNRTQESVKDPTGTLSRQLSRMFDALGRVQQTTGRE